MAPYRWLIVLALGILAAPLAMDAQQRRTIPRIGMLSYSAPPSETDLQRSPFLQELRTLGWVEGQNIIERRYAPLLSLEKLPALVADLIRRKVDVIVAFGAPSTRAAKTATTTIPIVMAVGDALEQGLVTNLPQPEGNLTGFTGMNPDLSGKRLELLKEAVPQLSRVAALWCPDLPGNPPMWRATQVAAQGLGVQLSSLEVRDTVDFEAAFAAATKDRADAIVVFDCAHFPWRRADLATKLLLLAMYPSRGYVEAGGLMSYGPNNAGISRRVAVYVDKILKGAQPADLPVQQPTKFELVLNLKTAKALGLTMPPSLLLLADEVIQ